MSAEQTGMRYWVDVVTSASAGILSVLTLVLPSWIEAIFHVDPDHGSGWLEWIIIGGLLTVALLCGAHARIRRVQARRNPMPLPEDL